VCVQWSGARDPAALTQLAHLHHVHSDLKQTAASYISHLRKPSTTSGTTATQLPTVPYAEALSLRVQLEKEHSTRKSLEKQCISIFFCLKFFVVEICFGDFSHFFLSSSGNVDYGAY
jgi:hypothetical protein